MTGGLAFICPIRVGTCKCNPRHPRLVVICFTAVVFLFLFVGNAVAVFHLSLNYE